MTTQYTIIEDCSPYYIRFTHDGIKEFIDYALAVYNQFEWEDSEFGFKHCRVDDTSGYDILSRTPVSTNLKLTQSRVSFFVSDPGMRKRAHKDGIDHQFSINYIVKVLDDKCITSWYSDEDLKEYAIDTRGGMTRDCENFDYTAHVPLKTMVATQYECVLFNTEIFHSWDNSQSSNERIVLTLRSLRPRLVSYDNAKEKLFGV